MPNVTRVTFNSYSGPRILGTEDFLLVPNAGHWERVLWLTSMVESGGRFGAITMYDGTAVTAGLHQAVAVYPRELADEDFNAQDDQGSFFQLLRLLQSLSDFPELQQLLERFRARGWTLSRDGTLRYLAAGKTQIRGHSKTVAAGDLVYGYEIREEFTPHQGVVPSTGASWNRSKAWALDFQKVFSHPSSFRAQIEFGAQHFEKVARNKIIHTTQYSKSIERWLYGGNLDNFQSASPSYDLALAVFWSHSVNAPTVAYKILADAIVAADPGTDPDKFAATLLRLLGQKRYGRWHFSETNGRWQRTRQNARKVWLSSLFAKDGVMPQTL